jgi:hypothetical protein
MSTAAPPSHDDTKVDRSGDLTTFGEPRGLRGEGAAKAVVATDLVSDDADKNSGIILNVCLDSDTVMEVTL